MADLLVNPGTDLLGPDRWHEVFGRPGPFDVEIGFGKDEFLLEQAQEDPDGLFLAVDYSRPRARSYLNKIRMRGLTNVRVLLTHAATAIGLCLPDRSVRRYYVLCPDPWPKERHAAHRLVRPWFAREAARTLVPGGLITLATDHPPYLDQIIEVMEGSGLFSNLMGEGRSGPRPEGFSSTIFERRWIDRGRQVSWVQFVRKEVP